MNANVWPVTKVGIVKCLVIEAATGSVVPIDAIVSLPTPKGAIQSVECASANPDGKVNSRQTLAFSENGLHSALHSEQKECSCRRKNGQILLQV